MKLQFFPNYHSRGQSNTNDNNGSAVLNTNRRFEHYVYIITDVENVHIYLQDRKIDTALYKN